MRKPKARRLKCGSIVHSRSIHSQQGVLPGDGITTEEYQRISAQLAEERSAIRRKGYLLCEVARGDLTAEEFNELAAAERREAKTNTKAKP